MKKILLGSLLSALILTLTGCSTPKEEVENINKVFVYGSLRSDMFNYDIYLDGKVEENKKATIKGDLFHLDNKGYPAIVPGDGEVIGELMTFKDFKSTLKDLDELEAYVEGEETENEYNRKIVDVKLEDGSIEKAYYYEYNPSADYNKDDKLIEVKNGDWKSYMDNIKVERVFVYGSLRSDMFNYKTHLDGKVEESIKGTINGDLFHIENKGYPAVVPGDGEVAGELMTFKDFESVLKELDELEAYEKGQESENEYNRKIVNVKIAEGTVIKAYYYEYNPSADYNKDDKLVEVKNGDWKQYMEENKK